MNKITEFLALPSEDKWLFVRLWLRLLWVRIEIAISERYRREISHAIRDNGAAGARHLADVERIIRLLKQAAAHHLVPMSCLVIALTGFRFLRARGIGIDLKLGVRLEQGKFGAHAWLELDGRPVYERPEVSRDFAVMGS